MLSKFKFKIKQWYEMFEKIQKERIMLEYQKDDCQEEYYVKRGSSQSILNDSKPNKIKFLESLENIDRTTFMSTQFTMDKRLNNNKDSLDLTFRENAVIAQNIQDDSSKSTYLRLNRIFNESCEIDDEIESDIPSNIIKKIPQMSIHRVNFKPYFSF